jgi:hypothetical protein
VVYRNQILYRRVFVETYGDLPQPCSFCAAPITVWGRNGDEGHIHHRDGDHTNNVGANLAAAHNICHQRHHIWENVGESYMRAKPAATRAKIAATLTGRKDSDDTKRRKSEALRRAYAEGRRKPGGGRPRKRT